jgi:hypothetical protein
MQRLYDSFIEDVKTTLLAQGFVIMKLAERGVDRRAHPLFEEQRIASEQTFQVQQRLFDLS